MQPDESAFASYRHLAINVDDVPDENLLEHFATANAFIQAGIDSGGSVLVHWFVNPIDAFFLQPAQTGLSRLPSRRIRTPLASMCDAPPRFGPMCHSWTKSLRRI